MKLFPILLFLSLALLTTPKYPHAELPSVVKCTINASANRSLDQSHGWVGPLPRGAKPPDPSVPFDIGKMTFSEIGFIFAGLNSESPIIRPIMGWEDKSTGNPVLGVERKGTLIRRTPTTVFILWEFAPNEFYLAVVHRKSLKAAISSVSTGTLYDVAVHAITADCQ